MRTRTMWTSALVASAVLCAAAVPARSTALESGQIVVDYSRLNDGVRSVGVLDPETGDVTPLAHVPPMPEWYGALLAQDRDTVWIGKHEWHSPPQLAEIFRVDLATGAVQLWSTGYLLDDVSGMTSDEGGLVVANDGDLVRIDWDTGVQTQIATGVVSDGGVVVGADGHYYVTGELQIAGKWTTVVDRVDRSTGAVTRISQGGLLGAGPNDIDVLPDGTLVVAAAGGVAQFVLVDPTTGEQTAAGTLWGTGDAWGSPMDVSVDLEGRILATSLVRAYRIDPSTGAVETLLDLMEPEDFGFVYGIDVVPLMGAACGDGFDNDGDGFVDLEDPGCLDETSPKEDPMCDDDLDNEGDGQVDWDGGPYGDQADTVCIGRPWHDSEGRRPPVCGLGFELIALAPLLRRLARARMLS